MGGIYLFVVCIFFLFIVYCSQFEAIRVLDRDATTAVINHTLKDKDLVDFNVYIRNNKFTKIELNHIENNLKCNLNLNLIKNYEISDSKYLELKNFKFLLNNKIALQIIFKDKELKESFKKKLLLENKGNKFIIISEENI